MSDNVGPAAGKIEHYGTRRPKVAPFARFKGTSAYKKYGVRARAYDRFRAAARAAAKTG